MQPLLTALLEKGYAVQLAHTPQKQDVEHGFVTVRSSDGKVIAESSDFQRNPFSRNKEQRVANLMASILAELAKVTEPLKEVGSQVTEHAHSDSEASTKAASEGDA